MIYLRRDMIETPVLELWGEDDIYLPKEMAQCGQWVPNLKLKYIPNCSHWVQYDVRSQAVVISCSRLE